MANLNLAFFTFTLFFWISCAHNIRSPSRNQASPTFPKPNTLSLTIPADINENTINIESDQTNFELFPIEMESIDDQSIDNSDDYIPESTGKSHRISFGEYDLTGKGHHSPKPKREIYMMGIALSDNNTLIIIGCVAFIVLVRLCKGCDDRRAQEQRRAQEVVQPNLAVQPAYIPPARRDQNPAQYYAPPGQGYEAENSNQSNAPAQYGGVLDEERARQAQNPDNQGQYGHNYYS